jgi:hypothetical protein
MIAHQQQAMQQIARQRNYPVGVAQLRRPFAGPAAPDQVLREFAARAAAQDNLVAQQQLNLANAARDAAQAALDAPIDDARLEPVVNPL